MSDQATNKPAPSGIRRVTFYTACPVETCDRCGQGIKHVALVCYKDDTTERFGLDCINKVLAGDTSLKKLWGKNARLLNSYRTHLRILNLPEEEMPIDPSGYYDRGLFFVADESGKNLAFSGRGYFHPTKVDWAKANNMAGCSKTLDMRPVGSAWAEFTPENWATKCRHSIAEGKVFLQKEIDRLEGFLARILAKGLATQAQLQEAAK